MQAITITVDMRNKGLRDTQAQEIIRRVAETFEDNQLPGRVEIVLDMCTVIGGE